MIRFTFSAIAAAHMARNGLHAADMLGTIPDMLSAEDPAGAVEQIDRAYKEVGGGWHDSRGLSLSIECSRLLFKGDPPRRLVAEARLRDERVLFFDGAWVVVQQPDLSFRVARID